METEAFSEAASHLEAVSGPSNSNAPSFSSKRNPNLLKCSCIDSKIASDSSSDTESNKSDASSVQSFIVVRDSTTHTAQKCCLRQRLWSVFNNERLSDVLFIVGKEKQRIPAHKVVLAVGSDVFNTMFSRNWSSESTEIEVPDVEPHAFITLLRLLYTDEISITTENVIAVLYAARKYDIQSLESCCVDFLVQSLRPSNVLTMLNQVRLFDHQKLINSCLETIDGDTVAAIASDSFLDIDAKTLCLLLERDTLTISEIQLFEAVLRWSEAECLRKNLPVNKENQQLVLKKMLPLLRFPLMSPEEFSLKVTRSGLLTNEELVSMYLYFTENPKPSVSFSNVPRLHKEFVLNRFKKVEHGFKYSSRRNSIDFTCDRDIHLLGYGLYGSTSGPAKYKVRLELEEGLDHLRDESAVHKSDGSTITYRALFKNPVKLTAFTKYTASVNIIGPDSFCGREGMKDVILDLPHGQKVKITFDNFEQKESWRTNVNQGIIPELIFTVC